MRKFLALLLIFVLVITGCSEESTDPTQPSDTTSTPTLEIIKVLPPDEQDSEYSEDYMKDPEGLDSAFILQMRIDYLQSIYDSIDWSYDKSQAELEKAQIKLSDIWIQQYIGNYSGCEVVYMVFFRTMTTNTL